MYGMIGREPGQNVRNRQLWAGADLYDHSTHSYAEQHILHMKLSCIFCMLHSQQHILLAPLTTAAPSTSRACREGEGSGWGGVEGGTKEADVMLKPKSRITRINRRILPDIHP